MIDIHCGDCIEFMKTLPDKSVNLVLTDPPYNIGKAEWGSVDSELLREPGSANYASDMETPLTTGLPSPREISNAVVAQKRL